MSLVESGTNMYMPVAPAGASGSGLGWGDGSFWLIVLFLFAFMNNGWGGAWGGNGAGPMMAMNTNNDVQRGFDQQALMGSIGGVQASINTLAQGQCSGFAGVTAALNNGFAQAEISNNARQMADMQQNFNVQSALQQCCCENRQAISDVKYAIALDGASTRQNTDAKVQMVMDRLCDLELAGVKQNYENRIAGMQQDYNNQYAAMQNQIDQLRNQLNAATEAASQNAQANTIINALRQPTPIPAYAVQNPNGCTCGNNVLGLSA